MRDLVPAEDFFEALFNNDYVDRFLWKDLNLQTTFYSVNVNCKKCKPLALHTFQVSVIDGIHYVSKISIIIFCKKHNITLPENLLK